VFYGDPLPTFTCADFRALQTAMHLTEALAAAVPGDPFFRRLAEVSRVALTRHLAGSRGTAAALPEAEGEAAQPLVPHRELTAKPILACAP
jgi:hypothetical protein